MKKIVSSFILCVLMCAVSFAQNSYTMGVSGTDITTCNAYIYDNGGENGNYGTGRDDWMTIHPQNGAVSIRFMEFDVAETDTLFIYNGTDPNNDSIPLMIGSLSTFWVNESNTIEVGDQMASATIQNPTGALTLHFVSAGNSETRSGFSLLVSCSQPCQRLHAQLDFEASQPKPHLDEEINDGYYYIDFCPGDTVHIEASVLYPDNDYSYHQDPANTYFDWSFGQSGLGRSSLDYVFNPGQGYDLTLTLRETHNGNVCYGQTPVAIRVRGSRDPFVSARLLPDACQGTELNITLGFDSTANIQVAAVGSTQESSLSVDSIVFIPDGPNCEAELGSRCYASSVNFTSFPPNATIQQASDILGVRLNIEHSFIGDININLKCPNSRSAQLMNDHNGVNNGAYFGLMYEPDNGCLPQNNPQGTGWNYCWSENSTYASLNGACYNSANVGHDETGTVDSSHVAIGYPGQPGFVQGQQYYTPYVSFSNLIGCPLNGLWQIEVCDQWAIDNGYVFSWELTLDPRLMPQDWTYDVDIVGVGWEGGNIEMTSDSTAAIITDQPGDFTYTFTLIDEFGCHYPHDMPMKVVQQPEFTLTDQNICEGESATIDPQFDYLGAPGLIQYEWSTGETTSAITVNQDGEYYLTINTLNNDHSLTCTKSDTVQVQFHPQPIVDFNANLLENCSPLNTTLTPNVTYTDGQTHEDVTAGISYIWTIMNEANEVVLTDYTINPSISLTAAGVYTVSLVISTSAGCMDSITKTAYLTVYAQPISDFISNPERTNLGEGGLIQFFNITDTSVFSPNDIITWTWNYGDGSDETSGKDGEHTYQSWGEFVVTLSVTTDQGCQSTNTHIVYVEADLIFPNIMTPNGDGKNDVLAIKNMNPLLPNILTIYDRWGKKVYEKKNYQTYVREGEEGTIINESDGFNAENLSDGVYYYTFHYEGYTKAVDYHGSLTIIRDK